MVARLLAILALGVTWVAVSDAQDAAAPFPLIVGGTVAALNRHRWHAIIYRDGIFICGGVIVQRNLILTSAHCVVDTTPDQLSILVGEQDFQTKSGAEQFRKVHKIIIHQDYQKVPLGINDLALLAIKRRVCRTKAARPVRLIETNENLENKDCFISGFGQISAISPTSELLLDAKVMIINNTFCQSRFNPDVKILPTNMCILGDKKAGCKGDSGGPLVCRVNHKWQVVGIVSYGTCNFRRPTVFMRLSCFRTFLNAYIFDAKVSYPKTKCSRKKINIFQI